MRVLVLGATGRLGRMLQWGWRQETRFVPAWHGRRAGQSNDINTFDILSQPKALQDSVSECDVVLCLAGVTPASGADVALNRKIALAVRAASGDIPLLVASSAAVYGRTDGLCREVDPACPMAPYGIAKLEMEQALARAGGPVTCLRIGNVAGADQILGRLPTKDPFTLDRFTDGRTPCRSYVGPATLARMLADLCMAAGAGRALPALMNVACPGGVEMGALLDAVPHRWSARTAPDTAIPKVVLDTDTLGRFTALDERAGHADRLVAEWRAFIDQWEQRR